MTAHDAFAQSLRSLLKRYQSSEPEASFNRDLWMALADLGVFGLATDAVGGTPADLCRAVLELGAGGVVGPVVETAAAGQLALDADGDVIVSGKGLVTVTWHGDLVPWARIADLVVVVDGVQAYRGRLGEHEMRATLAGEAWAAGTVERGDPVAGAVAATAIAELAVAAYVVGAASRIIELSAEYAATRRQFGHPIGSNQAVSQPLAASYAELGGLRDVLSGGVLESFGPDRPEAAGRAAGLRVAAVEAAARASYVGFQTQGGMGFVDGTELAHLAKLVRQVSLAGPSLQDSEDRALGRMAHEHP